MDIPLFVGCRRLTVGTMGKTAGRALPRGVIALGLVSMFMDVSSEMIHSLLPVFLVSVLGLNLRSSGRYGQRQRPHQRTPDRAALSAVTRRD